MALKDSISDGLRKLKILSPKGTKYLDEFGTPKTIVVSSGKGILGISKYQRNEKALKAYWDYYSGEGTVFAAIETISWETMMAGFQITSDDEESQRLIRDFVQKINLANILLENIKYALIYGDAFIEIRRDKASDIGQLRTINPTTVIINIDDYGRIESYQQKIGGQIRKTKLSPEEVLHLQFFPNPNSPYGLSLIEPSLETIERKVKVDQALFHAILRHTAKYVVTVGTPEEIPPKAVFDRIKTDLEDIDSKSQFVVPGPIKMETIDERGIVGVGEYFDTFLTQELIGLLAMPESLGLGTGSTEATAHVREVLHERMIRAFQQKIANQLKVELFNPVLKNNNKKEDSVHIKFRSITTADEEGESKWLGNLFRGGVIPFSLNEIRARYGYESISGGDKVIGAVERTPPEASAD